MKKYIASFLFVTSISIAPLTASAEGWSASKMLTPPTWITKPVTATTSAVTKTTKATWKGISKGTSTAWKKTTQFLDPFPDPKPSTQTASNPQTVSEFFSQERPE